MEQVAQRKPRPVTVDGWGTVYVRALTVGEVDEQTEEDDEADKAEADKTDGNDEAVKKKRAKRRLARNATRLICDENGKRLLDPNNKDHVALLSSQPWDMLQLVLDAANSLNKPKDATGGN